MNEEPWQIVSDGCHGSSVFSRREHNEADHPVQLSIAQPGHNAGLETSDSGKWHSRGRLCSTSGSFHQDNLHGAQAPRLCVGETTLPVEGFRPYLCLYLPPRQGIVGPVSSTLRKMFPTRSQNPGGFFRADNQEIVIPRRFPHHLESSLPGLRRVRLSSMKPTTAGTTAGGIGCKD